MKKYILYILYKKTRIFIIAKKIIQYIILYSFINIKNLNRQIKQI